MPAPEDGAAVAGTHSGVVFFTGDRACTLKKPVDLPARQLEAGRVRLVLIGGDASATTLWPPASKDLRDLGAGPAPAGDGAGGPASPEGNGSAAAAPGSDASASGHRPARLG
jgi:hypothetical protein